MVPFKNGIQKILTVMNNTPGFSKMHFPREIIRNLHPKSCIGLLFIAKTLVKHFGVSYNRGDGPEDLLFRTIEV